MFLFIFESIGTSELLLIGIIALIFLGPRKLPQIAKTIGKTLNEFRNTTNEFKATWEREVNFEEEERAIRTGELSDTPVARSGTDAIRSGDVGISAPAIKQIDKAEFDGLAAKQVANDNIDSPGSSDVEIDDPLTDPLSDKRGWI